LQGQTAGLPLQVPKGLRDEKLSFFKKLSFLPDAKFLAKGAKIAKAPKIAEGTLPLFLTLRSLRPLREPFLFPKKSDK
jgi:hypothetical protein